MSTAKTATGFTVTRAGWAYKIIQFNGPGVERGFLEADTMDSTGGKEVIPEDLYDPGELDVMVEHQDAYPTFDAAAVATTLSNARRGTTAYIGNSYIKSYLPSGEVNGKQTARLVLKFTGSHT